MTEEKALMVPGTPQNFQKYLFSEDIKKKFEMAVPKWLSVERLLRVVFASVMRNPKLLQCTTESLLSAVMQCAQLGLEPILGRAHLIPYRNNRKPGKPLECQFQPGYQGLVDLAERSGKVETVKAHVVYENDTFEIEYGLNERLIHRPKMDGNRGKPIGSYTVWTRTSGVKTYTFMLLEDIYRDFRSKSTAYNYAVKDKREDTPWIENEPEMLKKSLVKRHSKLEPASIEFMTAVEIDNMTEIGKRAEYPLLTDDITIPAGKDNDTLIKQFDDSIPEGTNQDQLKTFLNKALALDDESNTIEEIKVQAATQLDQFWAQFKIWEQSQKKPEPKKSTLSEQEQEVYNGFIHIRKQETLRGTEQILLKEMPSWSKELRKEWSDKWLRIMREPYGFQTEPEEEAPLEEDQGKGEAELEPEVEIQEEHRDPDYMIKHCPETGEKVNVDYCDEVCPKKDKCEAYRAFKNS